VVVPTDLERRATWIVRHDEKCPEVDQDDQQRKSGGWLLPQLTTTRSSEIVYCIVTVVFGYSRYHLFGNMEAGAHLAPKTRQALTWEQLCTQRTHIIVYARGAL